MSDATGPRLNRRTLLAAISTVGTVGALTGRGAAAYLQDEESLATNAMTAGAVTLSLDGTDTGRVSLGFTVDDYGYTRRDERTVCLGLDEASNPGWVWIRACPRVPHAEDDLSARVTADGATVFDGTLGGLLAALSGGDGGGVLLTEFVGEGTTPLSPGPDGEVCLTVAVWAPAALRDDPDAVRALRAASPLSFTLDVYAEQSRHVPTPRRPVEGTNPSFAFPACEDPEDPPEEDRDRGHGISNVSLCTDSPVDPGAVTWVVRDPETGADVTGTPGEVYVVEVTSPVPIDYVVVKAGSRAAPNGGHRRFDVGGVTTATVDSVGGALLDVPPNFSRCACEGEGIKLEFDEGSGSFTDLEPLSCGTRRGGPPVAAGEDGTDDPEDPPRGRGGRGRTPPNGATE
ncbi:hypothetical protein [Haloplanus halophilus]|uniref:hypothetical protein n=1 Tax=Haloplanus halophilus TaxID=2949993 RepID=UPI00203A6EFB|nr:hypothetical protein [Haloplanus sp. GDY1]